MGISAGGGGGVGAGGVLAFEWDRLTTDQLVSGGAMDFVAGGGGGSWAVSAVAERGNVLEYTPAGGTAVSEIAMFSQVLTHPNERRDLIIEIELFDMINGTGGFFGSFFLGDLDSPLHGFTHMPHGVSEAGGLLDNGVYTTAGTSGNEADRFSSQKIRGRKPAGAPPEVSSFSVGFSTAAGAIEARRSGGSSAARGGMRAFDATAVLGATWNDIGADRFGLAIHSSGGNPPPTQIRVLNFKVYVL